MWHCEAQMVQSYNCECVMHLNLHCQNDACQYQVTKISSYTST